MDILSQAVFGASTYAVAKGEATTKGDLLWGMALGMLVDADVFLGGAPAEPRALDAPAITSTVAAP